MLMWKKKEKKEKERKGGGLGNHDDAYGGWGWGRGRCGERSFLNQGSSAGVGEVWNVLGGQCILEKGAPYYNLTFWILTNVFHFCNKSWQVQLYKIFLAGRDRSFLSQQPRRFSERGAVRGGKCTPRGHKNGGKGWDWVYTLQKRVFGIKRLKTWKIWQTLLELCIIRALIATQGNFGGILGGAWQFWNTINLWYFLEPQWPLGLGEKHERHSVLFLHS